MSWPPQSINKSLPNAKSIFFNLPKPTPCLPDVFLTVISLLFFISSTKRNPSFAKFLPFVSSDRRRFLKIPSMSHSRPPFANPQALSDWLKPRLPSDLLASWGVKPGTKNVHNLWLELSEGETSLVDSSPPLRTVNVVTVRLMGKDDLVLVESRQQLSDGSFRDRFRPLSEKMKPNETVEEAVARAVKEELGSVIDTGSVRIVPGSYIKKLEERNSASYPGLPARYVLHSVDAWVEGLPEEDFCTDEQEEYQDLNGNMELEKAVSRAATMKAIHTSFHDGLLGESGSKPGLVCGLDLTLYLEEWAEWDFVI
ncbi:hypothetical protein GOBAR_AA26644 [Gossypium barbadense]|uniref:Nudix hydrolase domain-containing protein n=1 Tax=Gossypium barbadense TaxID=3634 RepID=A0A2P5WSH6_GOSBA|nr:hypothetical protein GOBAR_AA26644 [Gossypium barbadense]